MIGTTLNHYQITAELGAGGMGKVYRATDTKLGRDVTIKVLPATFSRNPQSLARFEREANHRSGMFAFGCILYEMLSGRRAFRKETPVQTMNAILTEEPPDLMEANPNAPPALERMVRRCLEKPPERRFQSASELGVARGCKLEKWDRSRDLARIKVPTLVIGPRYATIDPAHMKWMSEQFPKGRYLYCANGSHLALYDDQHDQQTWFTGLINFLKDVDRGK